MSQEINNREYRQKALSDMIAQLHDGKHVDEVKAQFEAVFGGVSAEEIAMAEQALIANGLPIEEVQRLCDVHAAVFKGSIQEIHASQDPSAIPGHPAHTLKQENRALEALCDEIRGMLTQLPYAVAPLQEALVRLGAIDRHYAKKENLLFPYMERYGITAPPKVMWGVDDEIRTQCKETMILAKKGNHAQLQEAVDALVHSINEMIFKEENIMLPMLFEHLSQDDWKHIADEFGEIGLCLIDEVPPWVPATIPQIQSHQAEAPSGDIVLPTGVLNIAELVGMLDTLPIDITFVDKEDTVRYFSQGTERVFPRTKAVIGRKVANCHPPASVHIVEKLVQDFRDGRKNHEDFWIRMGDKLIMIRYFAVRDPNGEYLGVLEMTQNIGPIQTVTGEKRLASDA